MRNIKKQIKTEKIKHPKYTVYVYIYTVYIQKNIILSKGQKSTFDSAKSSNRLFDSRQSISIIDINNR